MEKIAVHCPTKELILKVQDKSGLRWCAQTLTNEQIANNAIQSHGTEACVRIYSDYISYENKAYFRNEQHCKIIEAEEYLKEGSENVNERKFEVGDRVKVLISPITTAIHVGKIVTVSIVKAGKIKQIEEWKDNPWGYHNSWFKLISTQKKEESKMALKKSISSVYDKTADANVVDLWYGELGFTSDKFTDELIMRGNKKEILEEAKRLEAEIKETK